jgi:hypothetical protein
MTVLLEKAIKEMSGLTEREQDSVARLVLDAIHTDRQVKDYVILDNLAASLMSPDVKPILEMIVALMVDFARNRNVPLLSTEVSSFRAPDDGSEYLVICQTVDLTLEESMQYWDDVCDQIQSYEETALLPGDQNIARRHISIEIRTPPVASAV